MSYPEAVGLTNLGNTCYINSVVQSLYLTDAFHHSIVSLRLTPEEQRTHPTLRSLHHLFGLMRYHTPYQNQREVSPKSFHQTLLAPFNDGSQQDADEFAKYLLDTVNEQLKDVIKHRVSGSKRKVESLNDASEQPNFNQPFKPTINESSNSALNGGDARSQSPSNESKHQAKKHIIVSTKMSVSNNQSSSQSSAPTVDHSSQPMDLFYHTPQSQQPDIIDTSTQSNKNVRSPHILIAPLPPPSQPTQSLSQPISQSMCFPPPVFDPALDVDPYFGGIWKSEIECLRCNNQSFKTEAFLDLPLPLQQLDDQQELELVQRISLMRQQAKDGTYEADAVKVIKPAVANTASTITPKQQSTLSLPEKVMSLPKDIMSRIAQFSTLSEQLGDAFGPRDSGSTKPTSSAPSTTSTQDSSAVPMDIDTLPIVSATNLTQSAPQSNSPPSSSQSSPAMTLASMLTRLVAEATTFAAITAATSFAALQAKASEMQLQQQGQLAASPSVIAEPEDKSHALVLYTGPPSLSSSSTTSTSSPSVSTSTSALSSSSSSSSSSSKSKVSWSAATAIQETSSSSSLASSTSSELVLASTSPPVTHSAAGTLQLTSMLRCYFAAELLTGSDRYHCDQCHSKQNALKSLSVSQAPRHLLICLKRNEYDHVARARRKLMNEVKYPCTLTLPVTEDGPNGRVQIEARYVLYSVVIHSGTSAERGHYYAIARHSDEARELVRSAPNETIDIEAFARQGDFLSLNDSTVDRVTFTHLAQLTKRKPNDLPYLLFYRRFDLDMAAEADPNRDLPINPMLARLAELERVRQQQKREKDAREQLIKLLHALPKVEPYQPPAAEWTDPDM